MAIGPMDIHHKEFSTVRVGGYNKEEVDAFLDMVADELERLLHRNQEQAELVESMRQKANQFDSMQQTLQNAIINAQKSADNIVQEARTQAEAMLKEAQEQSLRMLEEARAERSRISQTFAGIREQVMGYIATIKELMEKNQAMIRDYEARLSAAELKEEPTPATAAFSPLPEPQPEAPASVGTGYFETRSEAEVPPTAAETYAPVATSQQPESPPIPEPDFTRYREPAKETAPSPFPGPQDALLEPPAAPLLERQPMPSPQETEPAAIPSDFAPTRSQPPTEAVPEPQPMPKPQRPLVTPEQEMELMRRNMEREATPPEPSPPAEEPEVGEKHFFWE